MGGHTAGILTSTFNCQLQPVITRLFLWFSNSTNFKDNLDKDRIEKEKLPAFLPCILRKGQYLNRNWNLVDWLKTLSSILYNNSKCFIIGQNLLSFNCRHEIKSKHSSHKALKITCSNNLTDTIRTSIVSLVYASRIVCPIEYINNGKHPECFSFYLINYQVKV